MLLIGVLLGLVAGLLLGGRVDNLLAVRLRWPAAVFGAVVMRYATELALDRGLPLDALRLPLFGGAFALLAVALWRNRDRPGLLVASSGVAANALAVIANGGWMPVWGPALRMAGVSTGELSPVFHRLLPDALGPDFLAQAGPFGDILPIPLPLLTNVASVGDVFLAAGLGWFLFSSLLTGDRLAAVTTNPIRSAPYREAFGLDQPIVLGGSSMAATLPVAQAAGVAAPVVLPPTVRRLRGHPYVRLALDARFSAFWLGQTISLFGDRLHQVALGVLVYGLTSSPLLTGLVFLAATLPNLVLGPIAGTFVDRWDHKRVMVVSDLLRAGLVLLVPVAALNQVVLVYPIVFAITAVSIFFRPAKAAVVPRIVAPDQLLAANGATWTGETLADIAGYPLAGLFVAFLGASLPLAFWFDAASYLVSALLLAGLAIPPVVREVRERVGGVVGRFAEELVEGWRFLSGEPRLFHNTLISAVAQASIGATLALTVIYARDALDGRIIGYPGNYAAIETAIGVGNLVGGFAVGALGARWGKGRLVVAGFIALGLGTVLLGLTNNVLVALLASAVMGVANLVYVIPTQTLFAELTPMPLMGRAVAFRSSLVFGVMTGAMAVSGVLAEVIPVGLVIALFGALTAAAGVVALLLPQVRDA